MAGFFMNYLDGCLYFFFYCCISNSLFMGILYKHYFGRLRLLRSSYVEENSGPRDANIRHLHKNLSDLPLIARSRDLIFCSETFVSSSRHSSYSWFQVLVGRCSCSGVKLICFEGWLYMCAMAIRHIDSAVTSVDDVKL